ncbi:DNA-binding response regulator [Candidatus Gottesmanbacteria bacterium RBG_16_52_11]|uniref:DNA-binding response regulator n=1 Tax=Candidatus Gottesmanbacteria bacterium RBG_16_52_11 TaxID=1798374 RepID=A0A1F5YY18_9BACT|nr:MAG: DNA-binding response regulator [Candidatus Gottesmanbacteria bacterium RBG_16_52_11]
MRVLVIEDEHKIANSIRRGLELESYAVDVAYDGIEGYDLAASETYDVIILDLMLPGMDGLTITRKLRDGGIHIPVLILTAKGALDEKVAGLNTGADDYLVKPFAFAELVARVRALARRPRNGNNTALTYAGVTLDPVSFTVTRDRKPVMLSRKEFALLEFLLRHPDTVLTKDQITSNVWSYDSDILPNTVEVYIGYLRRKIDKPFSTKKPLIRTVRGFGYKLSDGKRL